MVLIQTPTVSLHDRTYRLPSRPTVIVCVDGFDPEYLSTGISDGILPTLSSFVDRGFHTTGLSAMPSLTNPNNLSIITGAPTAVHGIAGNYYLDKLTGKEHMVLDDSLVRGSTILERMADAGVRVAAVTAKDKLRKIIGRGLTPAKGAICFSAQYAGDCTLEENGVTAVEAWIGRTTPQQYSADLSLYVLDAGIKLLQEGRADLFYLTLSDYVQHTYAPREPEADEFMKGLDARLGELVELGAVVAVTADHGMSNKSNQDGSPNVLFLEDQLNMKWPESGVRVICPIADPFVKHHGALGGFVRVHLTEGTSKKVVEEMVQHCRSLTQVEAAYTGEEAAALLEMPADREGDLVVIAKENAAIGSRRDEHDLLLMKDHRLRSHGGLSEQALPLLRSTPIRLHEGDAKRVWRNYDVFDLALNY